MTSNVFLTITMWHNCNCISPTCRIQNRVSFLSTCSFRCYRKTHSGHVNGLQPSIPPFQSFSHWQLLQFCEVLVFMWMDQQCAIPDDAYPPFFPRKIILFYLNFSPAFSNCSFSWGFQLTCFNCVNISQPKRTMHISHYLHTHLHTCIHT